MSTIGNNVTVNPQVNSLPQGGDYSVGLTTKQADDLKAIAKTLYGSKEGAKGGAGYVGAFKDGSGKIHLAKVLTHWNERIGLKKGNEEEYLSRMKDQDCAKALRDATERLCNRLIDIARAVGKESEVARMLDMKFKEGGGYEYPALLSREIGMMAVKEIVGNEGKNDLRMRSDTHEFYDRRFDLEELGKERSATIGNTKAKSVVDTLTKAGTGGQVGQKVGLSGNIEETVQTRQKLDYFRCIDAMKNVKTVTDLNQIDNGEMVRNARKEQRLRLQEMIGTGKTLQLEDRQVRESYVRVMERMLQLQSHIADRANHLGDGKSFRKNDKGEYMRIVELRKEFSSAGALGLISTKNEIQELFNNDKASEAFVYMLKKDMSEELAARKDDEVPITPRELDDFMFKSSRRAFICASALNGMFDQVQELNGLIKKQHAAGAQIQDLWNDVDGTEKEDQKDTGTEIGKDTEKEKYKNVEKEIYKQISSDNLFGAQPENDPLAAAEIKRYRVVFAAAQMQTSIAFAGLSGGDGFALAMKDGSYYVYNNANDPKMNLIERQEGECDYLEPGGNGYVKEDATEDAWGKMIQDVAEKTSKDTIRKHGSTFTNLFDQNDNTTNKQVLSFQARLDEDYNVKVY